jgi:hypothetical protein
MQNRHHHQRPLRIQHAWHGCDGASHPYCGFTHTMAAVGALLIALQALSWLLNCRRTSCSALAMARNSKRGLMFPTSSLCGWWRPSPSRFLDARIAGHHGSPEINGVCVRCPNTRSCETGVVVVDGVVRVVDGSTSRRSPVRIDRSTNTMPPRVRVIARRRSMRVERRALHGGLQAVAVHNFRCSDHSSTGS